MKRPGQCLLFIAIFLPLKLGLGTPTRAFSIQSDDRKTEAIKNITKKIETLASGLLKSSSNKTQVEVLDDIKSKLLRTAKSLGPGAENYVDIIMEGLQEKIVTFSKNNNQSTILNMKYSTVINDLNLEHIGLKDVKGNIAEEKQSHVKQPDLHLDFYTNNKIYHNIEESDEVQTITDIIKKSKAKRRTLQSVQDAIDLHLNKTQNQRRSFKSRERKIDECNYLGKIICPDIKSLNQLSCGSEVVPIDKLCNGIYDCNERSDETQCVEKALVKLLKAKNLAAQIKECYNIMNNMGSSSMNTPNLIVLNQLALLNEYENTFIVEVLLTTSIKDRYTAENASNQAAVLLSAFSISLESAFCVELPKYDATDATENNIENNLIESDVDKAVTERWVVKSCSCAGDLCLNIPCIDSCSIMCERRHNLGRWACQAIDHRSSIPLDMLCDGKMDCFLEVDENDCNEGNAYAKFQANHEFNNVIQIIDKKLKLQEYSPVTSKLLTLRSDIRHLQNLNTKPEPSLQSVRTTRDEIFQSVSVMYADMMHVVSNPKEEQEVYSFLHFINERLVRALKLSHTGNVRVIPVDECFCRDSECGVPNCPQYCVRACYAEPRLTKMHCDNFTSALAVPIDSVCDGRKDCYNGEDETHCIRDLCHKRDFKALQQNIQKISVGEKGTLIGEIIDSWKSKIKTDLDTMLLSNQLKKDDLRKIVSQGLHDLVLAYASIDDNLRRSNRKYTIKTFVSISQNLFDSLKTCGRPYYGFGGPPPSHMHHGGPQGPGQPPHMYPVPGVVFYPMHPAYFYPQPHPPPAEDAPIVVDNAEIVPELPGEIVELPYSTYRWVPGCTSQNSIPPGALRVGVDADGDEIYAGRAHHEGDILPAKVIPAKNACYIAYCGEEVAKDQFEMLVPAMFAWQFSTNGEVPPGAVVGGVTSDGEKLYYGRVTHDGCTTPGKIHPSHGCCYYPFDGEEKTSTEYEVLVLM